MRCPKCGQFNRADAETCVRCGASLMMDDDATAGSRPYLAVTLILAIVFLILGMLAYQSGQLLQHALHPQTSADVASLVCTSFKSQNYAQLTNQLEPAATPTTTISQTPTLADQLRGLDTSNGKVTNCSYQLLSENEMSAQYALTLKRAKMPVPTGVVLVLHYHSGGAWKISSDTNFTGQPH
jgi:hypothetical protein